MKAFILGAFNPVTNAHIQMGVTARKVLGNDCEVIYVPTSDRYIRRGKGYEEGSVLSGDIRVMLLEGALKPYGFSVSRVEVDGIVDGKSFNTLEYLGSDDSVLCIGMDNVPKIKKWYRSKDLLTKYKLLIFKRNSYSGSVSELFEHPVNYEIAYLDSSCTDLSSTMVRNCYINKKMEELQGIVPDNVFQYLSNNEHVYF